MKNKNTKEQALNEALSETGNEYGKPAIINNEDVIQEIINYAEAESHDHSRIMIDLTIDQMRLEHPDSAVTLIVADQFEKITSDSTNVKNAGAILGLSPPKGRPINQDKPISDLYFAAQYYRQENSFTSKTEIYEIVGENELGSKGIASKYEANAKRVYRACKSWKSLFNSNDIDAINRVLIDNDIKPIKQ